MRREPARDRLADVPAFRKREPSWKDEVRQRVRHRKRQRSDGVELPLFPEASEAQPEPSELASAGPATPAQAAEDIADLQLAELPEVPGVETTAAEPIDLPLRPQEDRIELDFPAPLPETPPESEAGSRLVELGDVPAEAAEPERRADAGVAEPSPEPSAVERPAYLGERVRAAAVDCLTMGVAALVVVYFASRAARVPALGLLPAWPYFLGFLAFFALVYAAFFTGLTGQTLGKMAFHLRVVDRSGTPPGHLRAAVRAALGTLGSLALVGIAPVFLDPARRALHDRLLKTRVIRL